MEQEEYYQSMLNDSVLGNAASTNSWYVRYVKDTTSGSYVPYFYQAVEVENDDKYTDGYATSNINCYSLGSSTKTKEVLNQLGSVEKDSTGRYISLTLYQTDDEGNVVVDPDTGLPISTTYSLTTNTSTDVSRGRIIPGSYFMENFRNLTSQQPLWRALGNSFFYAILTTVICLLVCSIAGYGFEVYHDK